MNAGNFDDEDAAFREIRDMKCERHGLAAHALSYILHPDNDDLKRFGYECLPCARCDDSLATVLRKRTGLLGLEARKMRLAERDGMVCGICRLPILDHHATEIDHAVPRRWGGE